VREIEDSGLDEVLNVDKHDVIEYVHKDLKSLPDFTTLYRRYLGQRWDSTSSTSARTGWTGGTR
jgi:ribonucleoside-diphosphate reductase beta chain